MIGTNRELLAASLAARAAASSRSMKISASMAVSLWFAFAVLSAAFRLRFKSARRVALNRLQHRHTNPLTLSPHIR